ncbi:MAG: DUF3142 domain-containing protein [Desulfobacterales bacterium]|nr:DUF3142 domain-containing protein [Desulfobacterales bacterium]
MFKIVTITTILFLRLITPSSPQNYLLNFPKIVLWAWERQEKLNTIDIKNIGIAYLAKTIYLHDNNVIIRPRFQSLEIPKNTFLIAVVRIESYILKPDKIDSYKISKIIRDIIELSKTKKLKAIQIDFDAKLSERIFYRKLLFELRNKLPLDIGLSITALASWCIYDYWISDLPIDEAVPMLFRMGKDKDRILLYLKKGMNFKSICDKSFGISLDEPIQYLPSNRRVYFFNTNKWLESDINNIKQGVKSLK